MKSYIYLKRLFLFLLATCFILTAACSSTNTSKQAMSTVNSNDKLIVSYIDVGQGDSILIKQGSHNMLIDTGTNVSTDQLLKYLDSEKIDKLDYLVLTHPHEDHIGGADAVIKKYNIDKVYMPKVTTNTKTFRDTVAALKSKSLTASQPKVGDSFKLGSADCIVLGPINSDKENLNTYSIVIKVTFGENKFLFTGDSEASNEEDMLKANLDVSADVLKLGHHGSRTSSSKEFLNKVKPKYAVVSCGKDNDYGHPHKETVAKLKDMNIPLYRTDESGTIVCTSDGKKISFNVKPGDYKPGR